MLTRSSGFIARCIRWCGNEFPQRASAHRRAESASSAAESLADDESVRVTGWVESVLPFLHEGDDLYRAAADGERHALENLAGDGGWLRGRLHVDRRRWFE